MITSQQSPPTNRSLTKRLSTVAIVATVGVFAALGVSWAGGGGDLPANCGYNGYGHSGYGYSHGGYNGYGYGHCGYNGYGYTKPIKHPIPPIVTTVDRTITGPGKPDPAVINKVINPIKDPIIDRLARITKRAKLIQLKLTAKDAPNGSVVTVQLKLLKLKKVKAGTVLGQGQSQFSNGTAQVPVKFTKALAKTKTAAGKKAVPVSIQLKVTAPGGKVIAESLTNSKLASK